MNIENKSGLTPLGRAVLVEPYEPEIKSSLIALPQSVSDRQSMVEQRVVVIAVGPECWRGEATPRAQVGERVLVARYAGHMAKGTLDGKQYRLVNDNDIFCGIAAEEN